MVSRLVATGVFAAALLAPEIASACSVVPRSAAISIGMSPASPSAGAQVRLTGGAGADSYAWDLDGDGQFDDATGKEVTASFAAGERTVGAQASTPLGVLTDTRSFTVHGWNGTPTGTISAAPHSARVGAPVKVTATGSDPDGAHVRTELDLDGDGTFETAGATGTATFASAGQRVIRARFTDHGGATAVATTTLDVHAGNLAPTVHLEHSNNSCLYGWQVEAVDSDGEIVRYEYDLDGDGTYETDRGADARVPSGFANDNVPGVRVTDDRGATAIARTSVWFPAILPRVAEVGKPATLTSPGAPDTVWDADGDGAFDDGTGAQISFTYPAAGTYEVRVHRGNPQYASVATISVREAADIAVPAAQWLEASPARPSAAAYLRWHVAGQAGAESGVDLDADGVFDDAPAGAVAAPWTFGGPETIAVKATDPGGRTAVATTQAPFGAGNFGPDAWIRTTDDETPLQAAYLRTRVWGYSPDVEHGGQASVAWDTDNDGQYDDGAEPGDAGQLPASFGLRATDADGATVTLRRSVLPATPVLNQPPVLDGIPTPWLRVSAKRPKLATLLRRGLTVDVTCTRPKCRTSLVAKLDAKTARKLRLRSRTVASRTVTGTKRVTLKLTPKAKRALKSVRSVKLTLTAKATAEGARSSWTGAVTAKR